MQRIRPENINTLEHWDKEYTHREDEVSMRFEMVVELIRRSTAKKVLDIGCGLGELYGYLKENNVGTVFYGTDFADSAIARNKTKYPDAQWSISQIGNLPFDDGAFECVVSCEVLEHMEDPDTLIADMKRLTKPGGTIIITTPYMNMIPSEEHLWSFNEEDIKKMFGEGYRVQFAHIFPTLIIANVTKHA